MSKLDRISQEVTRKTGIDFAKYRSPEVMQTLLESTSLVTNPFSLLSTFAVSLVKVFAILSILLAIWCYATDAPLYVTLLAFVVGYLGFPLMGFSYGITDVLRRIAGDLVDTIGLALDQSQEAVNDLSRLRQGGRMPPVTELFKGILLVVLLPAILQIINDRVGLFGKPFTFVIERTLLTFSGMFEKVMVKLLPAADAVETAAADIQPAKITGVLETLKPQVENILVGKVVPKVALPMRILFYVSAAVTLMVLAIVFWVMT